MELISILSVIGYYCVGNLIAISSSWYLFEVSILAFYSTIAFIIFLVISIVVRIIMRNKIIKKKNKYILVILNIVLIIAFLFFILLDINPIIKENKKRKNISNYVIDYLGNKYGNGDYIVEEIYDYYSNISLFYLFGNWGYAEEERLDNYILKIKSESLNTVYEVEINGDTQEIVRIDSILN